MVLIMKVDARYYIQVERFICQTDFQKLILSRDCQNDFISLHPVPGGDFAAAAAIVADWLSRKSLTFVAFLNQSSFPH